ncbi:beta-lactamase-like protein [Ilyonectria destructans]|nr:beta-lactamase-like protein [Ilyonectria destructans]
MATSIKILETGTIRIRPSHRHQSVDKAVLLRRLSHPEGYVLFDAGESPHTMEQGYFPTWMPFFHLVVDIHVREHEGIGARLQQHNLQASDLKAAALSHLHHDHGDGLPAVVGAPVYVSLEHWDAYKNPFHATMEGAVSGQWPKDFKPEILQATGGPIGPWNHSYPCPVTQDGKIVAVDTPGHVPGHISLIVCGTDATYLLLGDATYDQNLLHLELTDGVNSDPHLAVESLKKIKEFAKQEPVVLLLAHDPQAAYRLANRITYTPGESAGNMEQIQSAGGGLRGRDSG